MYFHTLLWRIETKDLSTSRGLFRIVMSPFTTHRGNHLSVQQMSVVSWVETTRLARIATVFHTAMIH